jgi:YD repeat-containing protein
MKTRRASERWVVRLCIAITCLAGSTVTLHGQVPPDPLPVPGFQRDQAYFGLFPFEHLDTGSGNLLLTFADWHLPGYSGLDLVFQRTFNSASGWTFGLAGFPMKVLRPDGPPGAPGDPEFFDPNDLPAILTVDGGSQRTWWDGDAVAPVFWTADFWRYHIQGRRLELPNGVECLYDASGALVEVRDRFANRIEIVNETFGPQVYPTSIRQVLGDGRERELVLTYETILYQSVSYRVLTAATYGTRAWTYQYGGPRAIDLVAAIPPAGPPWAFNRQSRPEAAPSLTVTVPQGGQVVYAFLDVPETDTHSGVVTSRETREGSTVTSQWTVTFEDDGTTPPSYRRILDGPEGVRLVYDYVLEGSSYALAWSEVQDAGTSSVFEQETRTYTATQVTDVSGPALNLLEEVGVTRGGQTYTTTLFYHAGDGTGQFSDYGRPWKIREVGDAGTRETTHTFDYDVSGHLIDRIKKVTTTVGTETVEASWTHNATTGFVETATQAGVTTQYSADSSTGAVSSVRDPHDHVTSFTYDYGVTKTVVTPMHTTSRAINPDGTIASETRRGATTSYEYDGAGRLIWVKPPLGHWHETRYDPAGLWIQARRGDGQNPPAETTTSFDSFGRAIASQNSVGVRTRVEYDALGRTRYRSFPYTTADVGRTSRYDVLGRVREVETGDGKKVQYAYSNGIDVTITDQEGRVTAHDYQAFGAPDEARLAGVHDAENHQWSYEYSALGRLRVVHQPGGTNREWQYTDDRLTREVHPESGETSYTYQNGRLDTKTTPRGTVAFGYDANDRLTLIDAPGTAHDVTLAYDDSDHLTLVENSFARTVFEFDAANRVERRRDTLAGEVERQTTYTYDGWDHVASIAYPSGTLVSYTYDRENRVTSVLRGRDQILVAQVLDYHPSGAPARLRFANGIEETYAFDPNRYWLQQITGGPLQQLTYTHDGVGNVTAIADARPDFNQSFEYDQVNRLAVVTGRGANTYTYDALGNRTSKALPAVTYTYDAATKRLASVTGNAQMPEVGTYLYDAAGNLTSDPSGTYTYTPFNMLETATVGGTTTTYRYDGQNTRTLRVAPDRTDYFYHGAGSATLSEYARLAGDTYARWVSDYIYLGGRVVAATTRR